MELEVKFEGYRVVQLFKLVKGADGKEERVYAGSLKPETLDEILESGCAVQLVIDEKSKRNLGSLLKAGIVKRENA